MVNKGQNDSINSKMNRDDGRTGGKKVLPRRESHLLLRPLSSLIAPQKPEPHLPPLGSLGAGGNDPQPLRSRPPSLKLLRLNTLTDTIITHSLSASCSPELLWRLWFLSKTLTFKIWSSHLLFFYGLFYFAICSWFTFDEIVATLFWYCSFYHQLCFISCSKAFYTLTLVVCENETEEDEVPEQKGDGRRSPGCL